MLRDINLAIPRGETLAIIGESGCGKTVLLKTIIGLLQPTRGTVLFDGQDLAELGERELTRQRIRFGFLFQQAALFDSMTIAQNVAFPLRQHTRKTPAEIREIVVGPAGRSRAAARTCWTRSRPSFPAACGSGWAWPGPWPWSRKSCSTTSRPPGLDPIMSDVINELILGTRRQHPVTSIVVTHDMRPAQKVADRVVMLYPLSRLEAGEPQIIYDGPPGRSERSRDRRVTQFVRGEAGERLMEMQQNGT